MRCLAWVSCLLPVVAAVIFSEPPGMSHFSRTAEVHLTPFRADLVVDIPLANVSRGVEMVCDLVDFFDQLPRDFKMGLVREQAVHLCTGQVRSWDALTETVTGPRTLRKRPRRFVVAALLSTLVAGVSGYIWGSTHATSNSDEELLRNQDHIVQVLRSEEHRGKLNHENLLRLARIVAKANAKVSRHEHALEGSMAIVAAFLAESHTLTYVSRVIEHLVSHQQLLPGFVPAGVLARKLGHLQLQARGQNRVLVLPQESDVYLCDTSYSVSTALVLRAVVHIPVRNSQDVYDLHTYIPAPFNVSGKMVQVFGTFEQFLAVGRDRRFHFSLSQAAFLKCGAFRDVFFCSQVHHTLLSSYPSCLWGLFRGDNQMVIKECSFRSPSATPQFWELSHDQFLVFHPFPRVMQIVCRGPIHKQLHFSGLKNIKIPRGCRAQNGYFELLSSDVVAREDFHFVTPPLNLSLHHFTGLDHRDDAALTELLHDVSKVVHDPSIIPITTFPHHYVSLSLSSLALIVTLAICAALFWRYRALRTPVDPPTQT